MASKQITVADVDQAEAALAEAKKGKDTKARQRAADKLAQVRSAWRQQEVDAGRRSAGTGVVVED